MDFDPSPTSSAAKRRWSSIWRSIVVLYIAGIVVEWCSPETNVKISPPKGGVYFHPQMLAMRVHLPLTDFVCQVLVYYNVPPTQLTHGAWRAVLGFEALCVDFVATSYSLEDFATCYSMRTLPSEVCSFSPRGT